MTREERARTKEWLKWIADGIAQELSDVTYEEWLARPSRDTQERTFEGTEVQVEIDRIEKTPTYVHIAVRVDDGRAPFCYSPVSTSFIVNRDVTNLAEGEGKSSGTGSHRLVKRWFCMVAGAGLGWFVVELLGGVDNPLTNVVQTMVGTVGGAIVAYWLCSRGELRRSGEAH